MLCVSVQRCPTTWIQEDMRMYTSVVLIALSGCVAPANAVPEQPAWHNDYRLAAKQGESEKKPLAIVFGSGEAGWNSLSKDGKLGKEAQRLLNENYVCLYIDVSKSDGKRLAGSFEMSSEK